jgi:hypothetical protein
MNITSVFEKLREHGLSAKIEIMDDNKANFVFLKKNENGEYVWAGLSFVYDLNVKVSMIDLFEYHFTKSISDMQSLRMCK